MLAEGQAGNCSTTAPIGRELSIPASDGRPLAATLFEPKAPLAPLTVIAAGAGIPRRYYARFAAFLAERGRPAVTFDYRDIAGSRSGSLKGSKVRMRDWCILDAAGVLAWAAGEQGGRPIHWVGHSMGGFATGLAHNNHLIARQLNVGTLSGYWRHMAVPERYRVRVLMGLAGPGIARALGYFPGVLMGGQDMPAPAFIEWVSWCLTPQFLFGDDTLAERANFARFRAPVRFAQIEDDVWGTPAAVDAIAKHFTGSIDRTIWRVRLQEAGTSKIGHHGFFRDQFRAALWPAAADWLDGGRPA
jgi:predicted alpha/beta hydrolase